MKDEPMDEDLKIISLQKISVSSYQPRKSFNTKDIQELADSIESVGLISPLVVKKIENDHYELIAGERRLRALHLLKRKEAPCFIRKIDDLSSGAASLIENIQRVDLSPIEIAKSIDKLIQQFKLTQKTVSEKIGKKRSTVANYLRLLTLPEHIQEGITSGLFTMGHAKALLSLEKEDEMELFYETVLSERLSVREAEKKADQFKDKAKKNKLRYRTKDFFLEDLQNKIQEKFGTKVVIQEEGKKGKITISYFNYDDLDRILALMGCKED